MKNRVILKDVSGNLVPGAVQRPSEICLLLEIGEGKSPDVLKSVLIVEQ